MFEKILYPTDFSDVSLHAIENCIPEIAPIGKELHIIHVVDITMLEFEAFSLQEVYRERLEELRGRITEKVGSKVEVKIDVPLGVPSIEIAEYAVREGVDLIIIPSVGENIWRTMLMGSTASNLARTTKKPVLILKYEDRNGKPKPLFESCKNIFTRPLVAVDFSKCSIKVVKTVKMFENLIEGGILLHSVDYGRMEELEHNIEVAKKNLEKTAKAFSKNFEKEVTVGVASQAIIGMALAKKATLIVLGKKGRNFLKDLLLGSTAERVMRDSKVPILLVPCD